jgi:predicted RNA-binding protein YlxR (DUF448 family)
MIRIGVSREGVPRITGTRDCMGRGSYVCPESACVSGARKNGRLSRVLKEKVPDDIYEELELRIGQGQKVSIE